LLLVCGLIVVAGKARTTVRNQNSNQNGNTNTGGCLMEVELGRVAAQQASSARSLKNRAPRVRILI